MPSYYEYIAKFRVPNHLVAQGETLDRDRLQHMVDEEFPGYEGEVQVLVTKTPDEAAIRREQS